MAFWMLAYNMKWVNADQLRLVVKTQTNPFGEVTPEEYKQIASQDF